MRLAAEGWAVRQARVWRERAGTAGVKHRMHGPGEEVRAMACMSKKSAKGKKVCGTGKAKAKKS